MVLSPSTKISPISSHLKRIPSSPGSILHTRGMSSFSNSSDLYYPDGRRDYSKHLATPVIPDYKDINSPQTAIQDIFGLATGGNDLHLNANICAVILGLGQQRVVAMYNTIFALLDSDSSIQGQYRQAQQAGPMPHREEEFRAMQDGIIQPGPAFGHRLLTERSSRIRTALLLPSIPMGALT